MLSGTKSVEYLLIAMAKAATGDKRVLSKAIERAQDNLTFLELVRTALAHPVWDSFPIPRLLSLVYLCRV